MGFGGFCYAFWVVCFTLPAYYGKYVIDHDGNHPTSGILNKTLISTMLVVTAAINGSGAGIMWVSQGKFISDCACDSNKGFYNSFFWCFLMSSNIIGGIIAAYVQKDQHILFIVFGVLAVCGASIFCALGKPIKADAPEDKIDESVNNMLPKKGKTADESDEDDTSEV